jgi:GTP-binding protein Era
VNTLVGQKVAIVSDKPQTTRRGVRGVLTTADAQIVFTDTPGFHKPRTALGHRLNEVVAASVQGVDAVVQVVDAAAGVGRGDAFVFAQHLAGLRGARLCAVNKVDLVRHHDLVPQLAAVQELGDFDDIVPVSATAGSGCDELLRIIVARLPEGPPLFPADQVTDQPIEQRVAEIVREKALARTREEIPHSIEVVVEELDHGEDLVRIDAVVLVERESQKGIVIGRDGEMLKAIGSEARRELEDVFGAKVFLGLRVKVMREWQRDPAALQRLGF